MRLNKDGSPDKRFKTPTVEEQVQGSLTKQDVQNRYLEARKSSIDIQADANDLLSNFLQENNIELTFDTMSGFLATPTGIKKLNEPQLVIRATYVKSSE